MSQTIHAKPVENSLKRARELLIHIQRFITSTSSPRDPFPCVCVKKCVRKKQLDQEKLKRKSETSQTKKTSSVVELVICKNAVKKSFLVSFTPILVGFHNEILSEIKYSS
jgi:hypothetical protein